ncbi:MAG: hypothetical protein QME66_03075 [Candidatus Eisenbacteria bacterium]|nr:hypothetical protein [Candidatus Eisenbacteria bacterium]
MLVNTVAAFLTLAVFSFLYRDNPVYKFAEYLFVGVATGYILSLEYQNVFKPNLWTPLVHGQYSLIIVFILGVLMFTRFSKQYAWLSRWAIALMVGAFSGLAIIGAAQGDLVAQIQANMVPFWGGSVGKTIENVLLIVGLISSLWYFFFSKEHKGVSGGIAKLGIWFLMISFGASFGFTVMSRISLLIGRLQFLFHDWLPIIK